MDLSNLLALRSRLPKDISADYLEKEFSLTRKEAVGLLQLADERGFGDFVVGRGSQPTRLVWKEGKGPSSEVGSHVTASSETARVSMDYVFPLAEFNVHIRLPRDLTSAEAERIARFVASLAMPAML